MRKVINLECTCRRWRMAIRGSLKPQRVRRNTVGYQVASEPAMFTTEPKVRIQLPPAESPQTIGSAPAISRARFQGSPPPRERTGQVSIASAAPAGPTRSAWVLPVPGHAQRPSAARVFARGRVRLLKRHLFGDRPRGSQICVPPRPQPHKLTVPSGLSYQSDLMRCYWE
jgi:hypothetical protein